MRLRKVDVFIDGVTTEFSASLELLGEGSSPASERPEVTVVLAAIVVNVPEAERGEVLDIAVHYDTPLELDGLDSDSHSSLLQFGQKEPH